MSSLRVLITISRTWSQISELRRVLEEVHSRYPTAVLVHGNAARGDQTAASIWHSMGGTDEPWPANWERYGKRAGPLRNAKMVESNPAMVLAFVKNRSAGASHCADLAEGAGLPVARYTDNDAEEDR